MINLHLVKRPKLWRVKHDIERPKGVWRPRLPEVFRLEPNLHVVLGREEQWLWKNINPLLAPLDWRKLLGNKLAFTNRTGFPGHADYVNNMETGKGEPRFDQARVCGGAVVSGLVDGNKLWLTTVDTRKTLPSAEYVMARPWLYFYNVNAQSDGTIGRFPQGNGLDTFTPLFAMTDVYLFLDDVVPVPDNEPIPSPFWTPSI